MKTPDDIKKGLNCNNIDHCNDCPYDGLDCAKHVDQDALSYIQQLEVDNESKQKRIDELESRLAQVERERDAAVVDIRNAKWCLCHVCQNYYRPDPDVRYYECKVLGKFSDLFSPSDFEEEDSNPISMCGKFKWRGVCTENTKEEK